MGTSVVFFYLDDMGTGIDILIDKRKFCGHLNRHAAKSTNWPVTSDIGGGPRQVIGIAEKMP